MMTQARKYLLSIIPEKVCDALDAEALLVLHLGGVRGGGGRVEEAGHVVGDGLEAVALGVRRLPGAQHRGHPGHGHLGIVYPLIWSMGANCLHVVFVCIIWVKSAKGKNT